MSKIDKIEELQNLLREDSQNFQARRQLAVLLTDCGFNEEALKNLIYLSKTFADDSGIFYNLGIVYEKLKNLKKAKESYQKAIEIEPDAIDAIYNLGLVCTDLTEFDTIEFTPSSDNVIDNWSNVSYVNLNDGKEFFNVYNVSYDVSHTGQDVISLEIDSEFLTILKKQKFH